jgi:DNA-binding transcriptional LysR family regulator
VHLDLDCVESFLALADERHYGRAAAALHITSTALTKRIQRLERDLHVRLLERDQGGVLVLTQAGERFAAVAEPLLAQERAARAAVEGRPFTVTLGLAGSGDTQGITARALATVRRLFALEHPGVVLRCRATPLPAQITWLLEGRVDVQMTSAAVQDRAVHSTAVGGMMRAAVVPSRSELGDAPHVDVEDLLDLPLLYDPRLPEDFMRPFWWGDIRPAAQARLVSISVSGSESVLTHVRRGAGMAVVAGPALRADPPGVRFLPVEGASPLMVYAARRTADTRSFVHSLVDALHAVALTEP